MAKIGLFDSGLGGLTVLHHIMEQLPEYDYVYFGDNGRAPYGGRSRASIAKYTEQGVNFLFDQGATLVIIACNTACTTALHFLQEKYLRRPGVVEKKILGIIVPTAEAIAKQSVTKRITLLGTETTVATTVFEEEIAKLANGFEMQKIACPLLVPIVEVGWEHHQVARMALAEYLSSVAAWAPDTLVLGCTHYPFLEAEIREQLTDSTKIIAQGPVVAASTKDYLLRHPEIDGLLTRLGTREFFTTGNPEVFVKNGEKFLGERIFNAIRVVERPTTRQEMHRALAIAEQNEFDVNGPYLEW